MADSTTTAIGNLTADPTIRYSGAGKAFASFRVAVSHRFRQGDDWKEETTFLDCVAYGSLAENIGASASKGTRMMVVGRFHQREWTTDDGQERKVLELVCEEAGPGLRFATVEVTRNPRNER